MYLFVLHFFSVKLPRVLGLSIISAGTSFVIHSFQHFIFINSLIFLFSSNLLNWMLSAFMFKFSNANPQERAGARLWIGNEAKGRKEDGAWGRVGRAPWGAVLTSSIECARLGCHGDMLWNTAIGTSCLHKLYIQLPSPLWPRAPCKELARYPAEIQSHDVYCIFDPRLLVSEPSKWERKANRDTHRGTKFNSVTEEY